MKKHLGLITAIGLVATTGSTVIACNTKQNDSPAKIALKQLIDQVKPIVRDNTGSRNDSAFSGLRTALRIAEDCHYLSKSTDSDYLQASINLVEALKEFNHPGYKKEKAALIRLFDRVIKYVSENASPKSPEVIANLVQAFKEAREVLENEVDPVIIKLTTENLEHYFEEYRDNRGT